MLQFNVIKWLFLASSNILPMVEFINWTLHKAIVHIQIYLCDAFVCTVFLCSFWLFRCQSALTVFFHCLGKNTMFKHNDSISKTIFAQIYGRIKLFCYEPWIFTHGRCLGDICNMQYACIRQLLSIRIG